MATYARMFSGIVAETYVFEEITKALIQNYTKQLTATQRIMEDLLKFDSFL